MKKIVLFSIALLLTSLVVGQTSIRKYTKKLSSDAKKEFEKDLQLVRMLENPECNDVYGKPMVKNGWYVLNHGYAYPVTTLDNLLITIYLQNNKIELQPVNNKCCTGSSTGEFADMEFCIFNNKRLALVTKDNVPIMDLKHPKRKLLQVK